MGEKLYIYDDVVNLHASKGYCEDVDLLASCRDTGNGYIVWFPSYSSVEQENYICMNYAEAAYLYKILKHYKKQGVFE